MIPIKSENTSTICSTCGGKCCKWSPGIMTPDDVLRYTQQTNLMLGIEQRLSSKKFAITIREIDGYDGGIRVLAPKTNLNQHHQSKYAFDNFGTCVLHTPTGCSLSYELRPQECRSLVPQDNMNCNNTKEDRESVIRAWLPKQNHLTACLGD